LRINYPMKIIGAGQHKTIIHGGFEIKGTKEDDKRVDMKGLTVSGARGRGVWAHNSLSFLCTRMTFTQCRQIGVYAYNTKGRLINCVITQCEESGIYCDSNALIELKGDQTKVDGNNTSGNNTSGNGYNYGLRAAHTSSIIHLLFPLTKESVSTNNHEDRNYGGDGTIKTVDAFATLSE
jgi:hypothetical protein